MRKKIYCFPYLNSYRLLTLVNNDEFCIRLKELAKQGAVIIIPTVKREYLSELADDTIDVDLEQNIDFSLSVMGDFYYYYRDRKIEEYYRAYLSIRTVYPINSAMWFMDYCRLYPDKIPKLGVSKEKENHKYMITIKGRKIVIKKTFGESKINEYPSNSQYTFQSGKVYGIIGEMGEGGEYLSRCLSGMIYTHKIKVERDGKKISFREIRKLGMQVGRREYHNLIARVLRKEMTLRKAIEKANQETNRFQTVEKVVEELGLYEYLLDYPISYHGGRRFRSSIGVGYACGKCFYCFPWISDDAFFQMMSNGMVFETFRKLKESGAIILLPTSNRDVIKEIADEIIEIKNPLFCSW